MTATMSGTMDLDDPVKYPIVLSDALLGRGSKEVFTGLRYNHKPTPSSDSALSSHLLKPTAHGAYDLSFFDGSDKYEYRGVRKSEDGQYALVFDPEKKHFVLHQVDSTFDMNLTSTPWDQDPASLRETYAPIPSSTKQRRKIAPQPKPKPKPKSKPKGGQINRTSANAKRQKVEKPKKAKTPPRKEPTPDAEDEGSDDGLTIEYPDGAAPPPRYISRTSPLPLRRDNNERSEDSGADAEYEEDDENDRNRDVEILELPSPATNLVDTGVTAEEEEEEVDLDLAAELEQALEKETKADESSESEEE